MSGHCLACGGQVADEQPVTLVPGRPTRPLHVRWQDCSRALGWTGIRQRVFTLDGRRRSGPVNVEGAPR